MTEWSKIFFCFAFLFLSCRKDETSVTTPCSDNGLPCITTEGKNTLGCKVNGENWVADVPASVGGPTPLTGYFLPDNGEFFLKGTLKNSSGSVYQTIFLYGLSIFDLGTFEMNVENATQMGFRDLNSDVCGLYYYDTIQKGMLKINFLDPSAGIIAGQFEMNVYDKTCSDTVKAITDGRFDFKY